MGTWGTRIYEDDAALDLRADFLRQHASGVPVAEIEQAIAEEYFEGSEPEDDAAKLALACVELETGTLTAQTKEQALEVIASGRQYDFWLEEAGKQDAGLRSRELTLIKKYLDHYAGKPVNRKSWVELQRGDKEFAASNSQAGNDTNEKLDDAGWHEGSAQQYSADNARAYGGAHIACFMYWLVTRDFFNVPNEHVIANWIAGVKQGTIAPTKFADQVNDWKFFTSDAKPEVRPFVEAYYQGGAAAYIDDYIAVVVQKRNMYGFLPTEKDYETMAKKIDERLEEYKQTPYTVAPPQSPAPTLPIALWVYALIALAGLGLAGYVGYLLFT